MAETVKRRFYFVKHDELGNIPLKEGNYIALIDANGVYYDVGDPAGSGHNITRHDVSANYSFVSTLPATGTENTLYIMRDTDIPDLPGTSIPYYHIYAYEGDSFIEIANNSEDINVTSSPTTDTFYITGSTSNTSATSTLVKRSDVFVDGEGSITASVLHGKADYAKDADTALQAARATYALKDNSGNTIDSTYIKALTPSSDPNTPNQINVTLGNDTPGASFSTYVPPVVSTSKDGLAPRITNTGYFLSGSGWVDLTSGVVVDRANNDGLGQDIADTYIKNIGFTSPNITYTKGNGSTTGTVTIPTFTTSDAGLTPASSSSDTDRYLRANGTWGSVPDLVGTDGTSAGTAGLVPAPTTSDENKFLKGDGTWDDTPYPDVFDGTNDGLVPQPSQNDQFLTSNGTWVDLPVFNSTDPSEDGLVPGAAVADANKYLKGDGTWSAIPIMTGTDGVSDGTSGLTPVPTTSDVNKYLKSNGTWAEPTIPVFTQNTNGAVPAPASAPIDAYLSAGQVWSVPPKNTTGTSDYSNQIYTFTDTFTGDGTTTTFTLTYTPDPLYVSSLQVWIDGVEQLTSDYSVSGAVVTITTPPAQDSTIAIQYSSGLATSKMYLTSGPIQQSYSETYSNSKIYALGDNLYSNNKQVATTDQLPTVLTQTLTTGQTTVTFTDASILATSLISVYANSWYSSYSQSAGSFSLTFPVQSADMTVTIEVK